MKAARTFTALIAVGLLIGALAPRSASAQTAQRWYQASEYALQSLAISDQLDREGFPAYAD